MSAKPRHYRPGDYLFKEGEDPKALYVIQKGTVAIRKKKGSMYFDLARIYSNEVIGELSFFDRNPRSASAIALTEVEALEIDFTSLDGIYKKIPPYIKTIMNCVSDRLRKANDTIRRFQRNLIEANEGVTGYEKKDENAMTTESVLEDVPSSIDVDLELEKLKMVSDKAKALQEEEIKEEDED